MRRRDKYLLGLALGIGAFGLGLVTAKAAPKMKARMEEHCREMMAGCGCVEAANHEREDELVPR